MGNEELASTRKVANYIAAILKLQRTLQRLSLLRKTGVMREYAQKWGMNHLKLPKGKQVKRPVREPDHISKRGIPYWFAPEWVRHNGSNPSRIIPISVKNKAGEQVGVDLYMVSKDGNCSYIQGSIQKEFKQWHKDNEIDCILLGMEIEELNNVNWDYE